MSEEETRRVLGCLGSGPLSSAAQVDSRLQSRVTAAEEDIRLIGQGRISRVERLLKKVILKVMLRAFLLDVRQFLFFVAFFGLFVVECCHLVVEAAMACLCR